MNEFSLIDTYFKSPARSRADVIFGIGDDAACLSVPPDHHLLVSTDTLVEEVHFSSDWDPYDIAWKSVMVNVSDIAAMAATPSWISLALTLPALDSHWLNRFSQGLHAALDTHNIALIGGDTTRGPLSITLTIHGLAAANKAVKRSGAKKGDSIWVSGELAAAALAVNYLHDTPCSSAEMLILLDKLQHPTPRIDLAPLLQRFATSAIDISDGLSADLQHICKASGVGALLNLNTIPIHPLVKKYMGEGAVNLALNGGDDYELCFTIPQQEQSNFIEALAARHLICYPIGVIEKELGMRVYRDRPHDSKALTPDGYRHF